MPRVWHSLSTDAAGDVIAAGEAGGTIHVSRDGGATWTSGNSPSATWIASAMSSTGSRIYAVQYGGSMFASGDQGATWKPLAAGTGAWESVATSQDGTLVAAVMQNGPLVISKDGGSTWHNAAMPDGQANHWWRWVSSSADGHALVAVSHDAKVFRSTDSGSTWKLLAVAVGGTVVNESWYRVKTSADGQAIAIAANTFGGAPGTGIYVSHDGGTTWARGYSLVADYTFLAMSADGQRIAATVSDTGSTRGRVVISFDGGATFAQVPMPGGDTDWRAIAMSAAGDRVAAATGAFNTGSTGLLYIGY